MEQLGAYLGSSWYPLELAEGIFDVPLEAPFGKRKENQRLILILMDPESLLESTWEFGAYLGSPSDPLELT